MNEDERIARIAAILGHGTGVWRVAIGDDAAVLPAQSAPLVWTIDEQVEDVHFKRGWCSFEDVGFRASMASASDLAAMGAVPVGALAALVLPSDVGDVDVDAITRGQRQACDMLGAPIVGGNLSRGDRLSLATTWLGTCRAPVLRSGARDGHLLSLCGAVGLAAAAVRALVAGFDPPAAALAAWQRPVARIADGQRMAGVAAAAIDISDGLAKDAGRLASASGVGIVIDAGSVRGLLEPATRTVAEALGVDPLDLVLGGGEDYALLCASEHPIEGFVRIGQVVRGDGVVLRETDGSERPIRSGFDHFADGQNP